MKKSFNRILQGFFEANFLKENYLYDINQFKFYLSVMSKRQKLNEATPVKDSTFE